jgi:Protein of unknown function (DUF559)
MNTAVTSPKRGDPAAFLDRHAIRRASGVPTVSLLVGPIGAGGATWRRWAARRGRSVVVGNRSSFPHAEWVRRAAEIIDLPVAAIHLLAQRAKRDPDELLAAWQVKTPADRERFWSTLAPASDDDLLGAVAALAAGGRSRRAVAAALGDLGERMVPLIARLAPADWPSVLFMAGSADDFLSAAPVAVNWAIRAPALPIALAVPARVWDQYVTTADESRTKALLLEAELALPVIDAATVERALSEVAVVESAVAAIAACGAHAALVESAVAALRASAAPPANQAEDDRAKSAAERFLFTFLESLPETAGRFELNASLDFGFGPRPAEVDLLCRSPRIAIELDGYFHFLASERYRRDRAKDWELQRRGFVVLRFLAEDVIPQLEVIRDRVLDALTVTATGENS